MSDWDDEILIGEGVVLSTGAAPVTFRIVSGLIDALIYVVAFIFILGMVLDATYSLSQAWVAAISITLIVLVLVIVPATVETITRGRSVGRLAMGLRIVREDGGPISFRHAAGRAVMALLEIYGLAGLLAVTVSTLSARGKRLGDVIMGTYAMRVRGGHAALPPIVTPPWLTEWAQSADMRRLPDGLALNARMFLGRAASMHVPARARIGTELAAAFREFVSPEPPPGTHPESFIAAVLATRRDREYTFEARRSHQAQVDLDRVSSLPFGLQDAPN